MRKWLRKSAYFIAALRVMFFGCLFIACVSHPKTISPSPSPEPTPLPSPSYTPTCLWDPIKEEDARTPTCDCYFQDYKYDANVEGPNWTFKSCLKVECLTDEQMQILRNKGETRIPQCSK